MPKQVMMSDVHESINKKYHAKLIEEAKGLLRYITQSGSVLSRDIWMEFGIPRKDAEYLLSVLCDDLCRHIDKSKRSKH